MAEQYYTMKEAAEQAGVVITAIYNAVYDGRLETVQMYGKKLVPAAALSHYKEQQGHRNGANTKKARGA